MKVKNAPEEIYLVVGELTDVLDNEQVDFNELYDITWCEDRTSNDDIKYVREDAKELSPLEKFERLLPCNEDGDVTTENGIDYIPKLYKFREKWFVEWKDKSFYNKDINKAIDKAYQWAKGEGLIKDWL